MFSQRLDKGVRKSSRGPGLGVNFPSVSRIGLAERVWLAGFGEAGKNFRFDMVRKGSECFGGASYWVHELARGRPTRLSTICFTVSLPFLYRKKFCDGKASQGPPLPVLNLVVIFIIRNLGDENGESERTGVLLNSAAHRPC